MLQSLGSTEVISSSFKSNNFTFNEGDTLVTTVTTNEVAAGTTLYWSLVGLSAADFGVNFNVEVYPFEDFADLLASFGFEGKLPRENVSKNKFSRDEVLNNDYCEGAFMKNYFMDQVSYTRLLNGDRVLSGENAKV